MRLRLKYSKTGQMAFLGHLEMLRFWQRALRRADLPVAMSHGFNPHPRLAFGPALAVGVASLAEYLDVELTADREPGRVRKELQAQLPPGLAILLIQAIPAGAPALTAVIDVAVYRVSWLAAVDPGELEQRVEALLARPEIPVSRPGKDGRPRVKDIRPGILELTLAPAPDLVMLLQCSPAGSVRPEEVLQALDWEVPVRITRTGLFARRGDDLLAPEDLI
ncbi:TIGR03936 family radical SAM-associated protein [Moorella naiadis]|uniref:TIGR03936 family radical SAM-associated protein n=1 Tax=Moorella naiadis (nom. illeg.) TaxID=3093670 RepID=UPI003D9C8481